MTTKFRTRAEPEESKLVYPLSALRNSNLRNTEVGDILKEEEMFPEVPDLIQVTGLIRFEDRVELHYKEARA